MTTTLSFLKHPRLLILGEDIMALKQVNDLITINVPTKEPGFNLNDRTWTKSSDYTHWKAGALYCAVRDTTLQTLDDAVEFRHASNGADNSNNYQHTRTLIGYATDGRAGLRAFLWEPSLDQLKELAKHPQIDDSYLQISAKDVLAKQFKKGSTFLVPAQNLELSVAPNAEGESAYSSNDIVKLLIPNHAKDNAAYIGKRHKNGLVWFDRPNLPKGEMRVRPVGLGGGVFSSIDFVFAVGCFDNVRLARGVASGQKNSP